MRKQYNIQNLDCAHCAMTMQEEAKKIPGVLFLQINYVSMKMTLEAEDEAFSRVADAVLACCRRIEPDVAFLENRYRFSQKEKKELMLLLLSVVLFAAAKIAEGFSLWEEESLLSVLPFLPSYLIAGWDVLRKALWGLFHGRVFDENFLMALATICAFAIGEGGEGVMVMILYGIGEFFQELAVAKSRRSITELMDIRPDRANLVEGDEIRCVAPEEVPVGGLFLVKPGEKIPLDGTVIEGSSFLDTTSLTGESKPQRVQAGDEILSGCINMNGTLKVQSKKSFGESTVSKILSLMEDSGEGKSQTERFITRFARYYTPAVVLLSVLIAAVPPLFGGDFGVWFHKAITCLVISCPCALVISVPLSFFGGIGCAGSHGILIKGAESVEKLAKAKICAFDKTGTLTHGQFTVTAIHPELISQETLLELAAACEYYSDHPISLSLKAAFHGEIHPSRIGTITETPGEGVVAEIDGKILYTGNELLMKKAGATVVPCPLCHHNGTVVHLATQDTYLGHIVISDSLRPDAEEAIRALRQEGIETLHLLSGDHESAVHEIARILKPDEIHASLLPQEKVACIEAIRTKNPDSLLIFVGDGVNDAPVLAKADLGIAMGGIGADAAVEAADVVLMEDKPSRVADAIRIAKKTLAIVWQNILLSVGIKLLILIPNLFLGEEAVPLWLAIFADVGVCLLAVLNSTRALRLSKRK